MAKGKIDISQMELDGNCYDLKALLTHWEEQYPLNDGLLQQSGGQTADVVEDCLRQANQITSAVGRLLRHTAEYLNKVGISLDEADQEAKRQIDSLTGGAK